MHVTRSTITTQNNLINSQYIKPNKFLMYEAMLEHNFW